MDVKYSKGAAVYILIPRGDFSEQKTILGAVDKLGIDWNTPISKRRSVETKNQVAATQ